MPEDFPFDQEENPIDIDIEKASKEQYIRDLTENAAKVDKPISQGKARERKIYSNEPFRATRSITLQDVYVNNERVGNVTCRDNIHYALVPRDVWIDGIGYVPMDLSPARFGNHYELYHSDKGFIGRVEQMNSDWMIQLNKEVNLRDLLKVKLV